MKGLIILLLFTFSLCDMLSPCLIAQYCTDLSSLSSSAISSLTKSTKCSEHGKCFYNLEQYIIKNSSTADFLTCVCDEGYSSFSNKDEVKCCYKQKSQYYAFLLEIIPGFGVGHFYVGNNTLGFVKLGVMLGLVISIIICCCCMKKEIVDKEKDTNNNNAKDMFETSTSEMVLNGIVMMLLFFIFAWQVIDACLFGLKFYTDGNGVELKTW